MDNANGKKVDNMDMKTFFDHERTAWLRWVNALLLVIVGFFAKAILDKMDDGLKMLIIHDKQLEKHELQINFNNASVEKDIFRLDKEIKELREQLKSKR